MRFLDSLLDVFQSHLIEMIVLGFFSVLTWVANKLIKVFREHLALSRKKLEEDSKEQDLLKQGMLALLRFRINKICTNVKTKGYFEIEDKQDLDDMFGAYRNLGGNGRTQILYNETSKLPVK